MSPFQFPGRSWQDLSRRLAAKKPLAGPASPDGAVTLRRSLSRVDLVVIGVAQIIGAGIFVISGVGVKVAGPGIILSFLLAGAASCRPGWRLSIPGTGPPHRMTLLCGALVALVGSLTPIEKLAYLCNIGTLFAFFLVCLGMLVLRCTHPARPQPFRCPGGKFVAGAGALVCLGLMFSMPADSWWRLGIWLALGLAVYFSYSWYAGRFAPPPAAPP
jgi:amino acid transporter